MSMNEALDKSAFVWLSRLTPITDLANTNRLLTVDLVLCVSSPLSYKANLRSKESRVRN